MRVAKILSSVIFRPFLAISETWRLKGTTHNVLGTVPEMHCRSNFYLPSTLFKHIHNTLSGQPGIRDAA
jgi:hypothetical protein